MKMNTNSNRNLLFNLSTLKMSGYKPVISADFIMLILSEFLFRSFKSLEFVHLINPTLFKMSNILDLWRIFNNKTKIWISETRIENYFNESIEYILYESIWKSW